MRNPSQLPAQYLNWNERISLYYISNILKKYLNCNFNRGRQSKHFYLNISLTEISVALF